LERGEKTKGLGAILDVCKGLESKKKGWNKVQQKRKTGSTFQKNCEKRHKALGFFTSGLRKKLQDRTEAQLNLQSRGLEKDAQLRILVHLDRNEEQRSIQQWEKKTLMDRRKLRMSLVS